MSASSRNVGNSFFFSVGVHLAVLFFPVVSLSGWALPPRTDVVRGVSSLELELVSWENHPLQGSDPKFSLLDQQGPEKEISSLMEREVSSPGAGDEDSFHQEGAFLHQEPAFFKNPAPRYPWIARIHGWEGTVTLAALIDPSGRTTSVRVARSSGFTILDEAAEAAVLGWRFFPAQRKERAVASAVEIPITFVLEKEKGEKP